MSRTALIAAVLLASLPAALCEAVCTPPGPAAHAETTAAPTTAMPCHGTPPSEPEPVSKDHGADCVGCQVELAVTSAGAQAGGSFASCGPQALPVAALVAPESFATHRSGGEPPDPSAHPLARRNLPLLL